jgi:hypothetical protein
MSKKTKESHKRANHKGNIKFPNPPPCHKKHIKRKEKEGPPKSTPRLNIL